MGCHFPLQDMLIDPLLKTVEFGNFLALQWLGLHASRMEVAWVRFLVGELRSHNLGDAAKSFFKRKNSRALELKRILTTILH